MKKLLIFFCLLFFFEVIIAQNKQILYGFDEIPQTLLLNPGAETNYKYHIGIPALSGISVNAGTTGFTVADLFRNDNIDFNTKVRNVLNKVSSNDFVHVNSQVDILNGGFKYDEKTYISFGFYAEVDAFLYLPKDVLQLLNEGNGAYLNRSFSFSQLNIKADALSVLHVGITRRMNEKLTVGGRLKIYSGVLNATTSGNTGTFTTTEGQNSIYEHHLNNINLEGFSSGFVENDEFNINTGNLVSKSLLGGNLGLGFDIGLTYHFSEQLEATASLLDVGFIHYSKDTKNGKINGNYTFSGINFQYDPNNTTDYWQQLEDDFETNIPREENTDSYTVSRPIKFNSSLKYSWGKSRSLESCYDIGYKKYYNNGVGAQLYSTFRMNGPIMAFTGFYERRFGKGFITKFTYTVDDYSYTNIGFGVSSKIGELVNIYATVDNVLEFTDIAASNAASFQFGINLIFK